MHWWSKEEIAFLREKYKAHTKTELLQLFNEHFNVDVNADQLKGALTRYKIFSGRNGRFSKGREPFNKGRKGITQGGIATQFKKGNRPKNYKPVGTERVNGDGYVDIKVVDPNKWKGKHIVVWEKENGPVPKGHVIIFGDGNRRNFDLDNLILVSRKQLAVLNRNKLIQDNADLTRTGVILADVLCKMSERRRE